MGGGMRYTGHGYIVGVPARDLTDAEVKKFGRERLLATGIYIEKRTVKKAVEEVDHGKWNQVITPNSDEQGINAGNGLD
jgi:hypothetical protein